MKHAVPLLFAGTLLCAAAGFAQADEAPVDRPHGGMTGATDYGSDARTTATPGAPVAGADTDRRFAAPSSPDVRREDAHAQHWWPLRKYAPDEEPWDPSWQMDPRIGRHQRANAPN